ADVTYGTNSEFGFDYLRDNMATSLEEKVQHGAREKPEDWVDVDANGKRHSFAHQFAIVDEVDNILIDEARTPLIISGAPEQAADLYAKFARLAPTMEAGKAPEGMDARAKKEFVADFDFEFDEKHKTVAVTERGVEKAERFLGIDHLYRAENGPLVNHLIQSLKAESLYKRDVDYAVIDGEVKIIDEFTGRIPSAPSRTRPATPSPRTPSARARSSPRRGSPARSRSPATWPAAASTSSSAATPSTSRRSSCARSVWRPATPTTRSASPTSC